MAALVPTSYQISRFLHGGHLALATFDVTTGAAAADEYVTCSGVSKILSVLGCVPTGTGPASSIAPVAATGTVKPTRAMPRSAPPLWRWRITLA